MWGNWNFTPGVHQWFLSTPVIIDPGKYHHCLNCSHHSSLRYRPQTGMLAALRDCQGENIYREWNTLGDVTFLLLIFFLFSKTT